MVGRWSNSNQLWSDTQTSSCDETLKGNKDEEYRGCQNRTVTGYSCQKWTDQRPHKHSRTPSKYPNKGLGNHNFCRNPDGEKRPFGAIH